MENTLLSKEANEDIEELKSRIEGYREGQEDEERFKLFRLTRGVYGQRQQGVQMVRIKVPYGKLTQNQLRTIANLSEEYTNGQMHITTRQNVQLHYVRLEDSPRIWESLEIAGVTTREACGNTVRSVTGSPFAGIDPDEPFDISPYARAVTEYFLRNPICQDMGRKIKIAFSSSDLDKAFTYIHDFGFIPKVKDGIHGFRVLVGGGLGAQAFMGVQAYEFLAADQLIPFIESSLRVFDRYGERERRHKARLKYLIEPSKGIGLDGFLTLVEEQRNALPFKSFPIAAEEKELHSPILNHFPALPIKDIRKFESWKHINVFEQKQKGYYAIKVRVPLGNLTSKDARAISDLVDKYAAKDIRLTVNQGLLIKFVRYENLPNIYAELEKIGFAEPGFDSLVDITACPGTDTCNLGVTNSTALSTELEDLVRQEYPELIDENQIKIKISGCMNSCGQHMVANIGFHGSSIKYLGKVLPAMQVVIGGGVDPDGKGYIAEKVIKLPTRRIPDAVRLLLDDYEDHASDDQYFNEYYRQQGKIYFYDLLKKLADLSTVIEEEYLDWGREVEFIPAIGVGECAGVTLDLVETVLLDSRDRLDKAREAFVEQRWSDSIYYGYHSFVIAAKALLLDADVHCNTHNRIITDFENHFIESGKIEVGYSFAENVNIINVQTPSEAFAYDYLETAARFLQAALDYRSNRKDKMEKAVVSNYYKA